MMSKCGMGTGEGCVCVVQAKFISGVGWAAIVCLE